MLRISDGDGLLSLSQFWMIFGSLIYFFEGPSLVKALGIGLWAS